MPELDARQVEQPHEGQEHNCTEARGGSGQRAEGLRIHFATLQLRGVSAVGLLEAFALHLFVLGLRAFTPSDLSIGQGPG